MNDWANRIVETGEKPARAYLAHPMNARIHGHAQRSAMKSNLDRLGWLDSVMITRSGLLLDGHDRVSLALERSVDEPVPYRVVDLSEEEERIVLRDYDLVGSLGAWDAKQLGMLVEQATSIPPTLLSYLNTLAQGGKTVLATTPLAPSAPAPSLSDDETDDEPSFPVLSPQTVTTDYTCPKCGYAWAGRARRD